MSKPDTSWQSPYLSNTKAACQLLGLSALLSPFLDKVSSQRGKMWSDHAPQAQLIHGCEHPKIYTGFESIFGEYEHNTTTRDQGIQITETIPKFIVNNGAYPLKANPSYTIVYRGAEDNKIGYFTLEHHTPRSGGYGYQNIWLNTSQLNRGNFIAKDLPLCTSPAHKGNMYAMGTNLKVAFMSLPQTTEDAFVISESAARRLSADAYDKISFKILPNQIPLNLFGDESEYKFFPDIGECVGEDGVICALRTPSPETFVSDMTKENLSKIQELHDTIFHVPPGAQIVDVDVVVNRKCKVKTPKDIFTQVQKYRDQINGYNIRVWEAYKDAENKGLQITPAFNTLVTRCIASLLADNVRIPGYSKRADVTLVRKKEAIEFIYITLTYKFENKVNCGFKLSDRNGGKGTISNIWPDSRMARDEFGNVADIMIDEISVFNRMGSCPHTVTCVE